MVQNPDITKSSGNKFVQPGRRRRMQDVNSIDFYKDKKDKSSQSGGVTPDQLLKG